MAVTTETTETVATDQPGSQETTETCLPGSHGSLESRESQCLPGTCPLETYLLLGTCLPGTCLPEMSPLETTLLPLEDTATNLDTETTIVLVMTDRTTEHIAMTVTEMGTTIETIKTEPTVCVCAP